MTISIQDAANIINYLYAAQAITVTDNQHAVWADYINSEMPELQPRDIPASARRAIKDWSQHGRAWKIDPQQFVTAARAIRADRVGRHMIPDAPMSISGGDEYSTYMQTYRLAIADGYTPEQANTISWEAVGRPEDSDPSAVTAAPERIQEILNQTKVKQP